jgi:cysteinyl-tRNA synthetase
MVKDLQLYNTLTRKKEAFQPIHPPRVGMYVCGPTVYGDAHLGHSRSALTFDIVYRYLSHLGYKVRYVRNITDVGHLEHDADEGEDKIGKKAKLESLEPMEIVQYYTTSYHRDMDLMNIRRPNIEPSATGHMLEQIQMVQAIIESGYAYESDGSVYFDVKKYNEDKDYGKLSGRNINDLLEGTRNLERSSEKRNSIDFALWKKASPEHIMRWKSPWSEGFPGWHLECSTMSSKYLGTTFDIHGGGLDLLFPHHECEIAQSQAAHKTDPAKYWLHNNMITINGQKMGKSLNNFITLQQLYKGTHELLEQAYSPMTIRFFILQAHYRSTLDFSNEAMKAANKGYRKLINGLKILRKMDFIGTEVTGTDEKLTSQIQQLRDNCYRAMNDDLNTAVTIANLFNLLKLINRLHTKNLDFESIGRNGFNLLKETYNSFVEDVLGLQEEKPEDFSGILQLVLDLYKDAKESKNYDKVDLIRAGLKTQGIVLKDMKDGIDWAYEE